MPKVQKRDLMDGLVRLSEIKAAKIVPKSPSVAMLLAQLRRKLNNAYTEYESTRLDLVEQYADRDDKGEIVYELDPETKESSKNASIRKNNVAFTRALMALQAQQVEVDLPLIKASDLGAKALDIAADGLLDFIEDDSSSMSSEPVKETAAASTSWKDSSSPRGRDRRGTGRK